MSSCRRAVKTRGEAGVLKWRSWLTACYRKYKGDARCRRADNRASRKYNDGDSSIGYIGAARRNVININVIVNAWPKYNPRRK